MPTIDPSRLIPPSISRVVERPRLLNRLKEHENHRLIFILGQPAQGKSILAASFARVSGTDHAWINLAPEDDNPVNLFYATAAALRPFLPARVSSLLKGYPASQLGPRDRHALYVDWSLALFKRITSSVRIVFDGLDRLPDESEAFPFLETMLEEAPQQVTFTLISRKTPPFPVQEWKIKQRALVLDNRELAFTYHETRAFLGQYCGVSCGPEQVRKVWKTTEGWAGGLILLAQVLINSENPETELVNIQGLPDRFQAEVFLYFAHEIFSGVSERDAHILLHSSIFEEITAPFLDRVLNTTGSAELLRELAWRNLFVHAVYDPALGWTYRYHQLFRAFLKTKWREGFAPQKRNRFLCLAARACARWSRLDLSVDFFLQAEEFSLAASALKVLGRQLIRTRRDEDLAKLLNRFPERVIQAGPWLLLYRSYCRRYTHAAENIPDLQKADTLFHRAGNIRGLMLTLGYLLEAVFLMGRDPVPIHDLLARGNGLLADPRSSRYPRDQALLWLQMGFCFSLRGYNVREGYRASQNAFLLARKLKDRPLQIQALIYSIIPLTFVGEFAEADTLREHVEKMLHKTHYPELEALFLKIWSELALFGGRRDLQLAKRLTEQLNERVSRLGLLYLQAPALYSELGYHMYAGNTEAAEQIGRRLLDFAEATDNSHGKGFCLILLGLLAYRNRQWERARDCIEAGLEIFRLPTTSSYLHQNQFSIAAGLVHMHLDEWRTAQALLLGSLEYFTEISSHLARAETLLSLALLSKQRGDREKALEYLESGLSITSDRQITHFVILSPLDQINVCLLALERGSKTAQDCACRLMHNGLSETVAAEASRLLDHPHRGVRETVSEVLRSRHREQRPRIFIQSLGQFRIWVGGRILSDSLWEGNQAKNLLKALVALASERPVRKEFLIDQLWPESPPGSGEKTFRVALHRLRRTLEPDMSPEFGSSYIHLKHGHVALDSELCRTDIQRFLRLYREMKDRIHAGETSEALQTVHSIDTVYQGDFLPDEPEKDWAREVRERLRQTCIEAHFDAARAYESTGSWTKAIRHYQTVLERDPLLEEAYRRIMRLYADKGKRNKALQVYELCRKNLRNILDVEPEDLTTSLYRNIKG
jgi:ATP/maltotriose-dependent transcriptional regulator MalT